MGENKISIFTRSFNIKLIFVKIIKQNDYDNN